MISALLNATRLGGQPVPPRRVVLNAKVPDLPTPEAWVR
jgi:hypothetical protein